MKKKPLFSLGILSIVNLIKDSQRVQFASYFTQNSVYFYYY